MKRFFEDPTTTRFGQTVGKGQERVMLDSVGGPDEIRKAYQINPDGTTTMLSTRGGFPEFSTPAKTVAPGVITVSAASAGGGSTAIHSISVSPHTSASSYSFSLVGVTAIAGLDYVSPLTNAAFSNGVTISGGSITVPAGVTTFSAAVTILLNLLFTHDPATYEMHVGSAVGIGSISQF